MHTAGRRSSGGRGGLKVIAVAGGEIGGTRCGGGGSSTGTMVGVVIVVAVKILVFP